MPRGVKKEHLPSKICVVCHRPFTWRKKWEKVWDEVTTCSKSCNRQRRSRKQSENVEGRISASSSERRNQGVHDDVMDIESTASLPLISEQEAVSILFTSLSSSENDNDNNNEEEDAENQSVGSNISNEEDEDNQDNASDNNSNEPLDPRAARKAAKKRQKALRRAQREGRADASVGQKTCTVCGKSVDQLIRCTIDASGDWNMVCGKCWHVVSGGVVDGSPDHPYYRYGGLWKNRAKR